MRVETVTRSFEYNGVSLPDPGIHMTPEAVRDFYSAMYPEIATATVEAPEQKGGKLCYSFRRAVGTKA